MNIRKPVSGLAWFCLWTHSKHEHLAADWLRRYLGVESYAPRIRFRRLQKRGMVWYTDALFPNYLFARFDLAKSLHKIETAPGIRRAVRFGDYCPRVPDEVIQGLRRSIGSDQPHVIDEQPRPGELVQVAAAPFYGLEAVVTQVMPSRQRVAVLLDFLGRQTPVELPSTAVAPIRTERYAALHA